MLGMAPVGAADMKGYDTWVAAPRPRGMKDVGSRQSPSIERIAALKPDLIVVPDYRSTKNLNAAQEDRAGAGHAPVPGVAARSSTRWSPTSGGSPTRSAAQVARRAASCRTSRNNLARNKAKIKRGGRAGASVAIATPGRHHRARPRSACSRPTRRPPTSCAGSACATAGRDRPLRLRDGRARGALARERLAGVRLPAAVLQAGQRHHRSSRRTSGCRS